MAEARDFPRPDYEFCDIVGTGGDGLNTINVSTTSALVAAACGLKVAKHGNRSVSSKSGSSDLLDKMGIKLDMSPAQAPAAWMSSASASCSPPVPRRRAPRHAGAPGPQDPHPVQRAGATHQPRSPHLSADGGLCPELVRPIAETLLALGLKTGMVVHGAGLDEIAIHGPTQVAQIRDGEIREFLLTPADFGLETYPVSAIQGGEPEENRAITAAILEGRGTPAHNAAIAANVAPLLLMAGKAKDLKSAAVGAGGAGKRQDGRARRSSGHFKPSGSGPSGGMMSATMSHNSHSERPQGKSQFRKDNEMSDLIAPMLF